MSAEPVLDIPINQDLLIEINQVINQYVVRGIQNGEVLVTILTIVKMITDGNPEALAFAKKVLESGKIVRMQEKYPQ